MRSFSEIERDARENPAFSNGTEGHAWEANWCHRCVHDAPFRNMGKGTGCPILAVALLGDKTPAEWFEQPWGERGPRLGDRYHCIEFRTPGEGCSAPRPQPEPPGMDGLFERPERRSRMLVQPFERGVLGDA